jgi:hemerythrin-like domain-containing protein
MEFSRVLRSEHKPIQRALNVLESMRQKIQQEGSVDVHDVNAILTFIHCFDGGCHQAKEESILFPALRRSLQARYRHDSMSGITNIESLLEKHKQELDLIERTRVALLAQEGPDFAEHVRKLIEIISEHIIEEEQILFPMAEEIFTQQEGIAVGLRLQEADASFGECQIRLLLDMLSRLEEKFISKAA